MNIGCSISFLSFLSFLVFPRLLLSVCLLDGVFWLTPKGYYKAQGVLKVEW